MLATVVHSFLLTWRILAGTFSGGKFIFFGVFAGFLSRFLLPLAVMNTLKIGIIGGGAAGMMAAAAAKEMNPEAEVLLFEKNPGLGAKVIISGGGRCNVTTGNFDVRKVLENYPRGAKFLMSAMFRFPPEKVKEWFENHGVPLKIEDDLRVFPVSNNGKDVVGALENMLRETGVEIFTKANIGEVFRKDEMFCLKLKDGGEYFVNKLILTCGGHAYSHTGSTGDGYAFSKALGHTVTPLAPSLNSFVVAEKWVREFAGVSFQKGRVKLVSFDGARSYERDGAFMLTHSGVTGPVTFAISSAAAYEIYDVNKPMKLFINFFPQEKIEDLRARFMDLAAKNGKKQIVNFLDLFLPKSLCSRIVENLGVKPDLQVSELKKEQRENILQLFQNFQFQVIGRGAGDEFVTAGGVNLAEVNSNSMESKICPGLYFAGEILDMDGFTGGFNLQAAWATGRLAGEKAAE
jgi:hypothetical protein